MAKYPTDTAVEYTDDTTPTLGTIEITKVVRETIPLKAGGGIGIGQFIEGLISEAVRDGEEFQHIGVDFTHEQWEAFK